MKLPEWSVRRPVTVTMIFLGIFGIGILSLKFLPIDLMPEVTLPAMAIVTLYPGASPEEVEDLVTEVIEDYVATVPNLKEIESRSVENISVVNLRFNWGTNMDEAANDVRSRLDMAKRWLPEDIEPPAIYKFDVNMWPILFYGVSAEESYPRLRKLLEDRVIDPLKRLPGVALAVIIGGPEREIQVKVDREKLSAYSLSLNQVIQAIKNENLNVPTGHIKFGFKDYSIRAPGKFTTVQEIENVVVGYTFADPMGRLTGEGMVPIRVKDVARVIDGFKEKETKVYANGRPGLLMFVQKQSGANTVEVAERVKREIEKLKKNLPPDVELYLAVDASDFIKRAINNLTNAIWYGGILVVLVVFFFLRQLRGSLVIALTIPFSLIVAFIFLFLTGETINMISLFSLVIGIGMVVDNAIVVYENIFRYRESGIPIEESAVNGASEVGLAVTASTFTTIAVFFPIIFIKGITGILFKQLGLIVSIVILTSLIVSLTLTPMLASQLLRFKERRGRVYELSEKFFIFVENIYARIINFAVEKPGVIIAGFIILFFLSLTTVVFIGTEFFPEEDQGQVNGTIELPLGTRVEISDEIGREIMKIIKENVPEARTYFLRAGPTETGWGTLMGRREDTNIIYTGLRLVEKSKRKRSNKEIAYNLDRMVRELPGIVRSDFTIEDPMRGVMLGGIKPIALEIYGRDLEEVARIAEDVYEMLKTVPGTHSYNISFERGKPELWVEVERMRSGSFGIPYGLLAYELRGAFAGITASKYTERGEDYDIVVKYDDEYRDEPYDVKQAVLFSLFGKKTRLYNIADVEERKGPVEILRKNQSRMIRVEADIFGRPLGDVVKDVEKRLKEMNIPPDVEVKFAGAVEEQREAFSALRLAFILALFLVYAIMASQFESFVDPFLIMFSVPFAVTGVLLGLFITGNTINIVSIIGMIALAGVVVNNAIVFVDYTNILRARGYEIREALITAGRRRLRPILMTALTTIFGMLPLVFMRGEGSEAWRPLGISMISGLFVSTFITLVFLPALYKVVKGRRAR